MNMIHAKKFAQSSSLTVMNIFSVLKSTHMEGCHAVHPNFVFTSMVVEIKDKTANFIKLQNVQLSIEMRVQIL
jgi:hypothetical protein